MATRSGKLGQRHAARPPYDPGPYRVTRVPGPAQMPRDPVAEMVAHAQAENARRAARAAAAAHAQAEAAAAERRAEAHKQASNDRLRARRAAVADEIAAAARARLNGVPGA